MAFNAYQFAIGFVLANQQKKRLEEKGAQLPNRWDLSQSLLFGALPNPALSSVLLQNEYLRRDREVSAKNQEDLGPLRAENERLKKSNETLLLRNAELNGTVESLHGDLTSLASNLEESRKKTDALEAENATLRERIAELEKQPQEERSAQRPSSKSQKDSGSKS